MIQKLVRRWKEIRGRLKRQKGISKRVCLKLTDFTVVFDAVSASGVFLVYFYPRSWNASEQSKLLQMG